MFEPKRKKKRFPLSTAHREIQHEGHSTISISSQLQTGEHSLSPDCEVLKREGLAPQLNLRLNHTMQAGEPFH